MTKEQLVKSLRACGRNCCDDCVCFKEKILCKVKNLEAADLIEQQTARIAELEAKVPRWIPATERLPETAGSYIVCTKSGGVAKVNFYPELGRSQRIFTHWMPLPEPPETGGGGEDG